MRERERERERGGEREGGETETERERCAQNLFFDKSIYFHSFVFFRHTRMEQIDPWEFSAHVIRLQCT